MNGRVGESGDGRRGEGEDRGWQRIEDEGICVNGCVGERGDGRRGEGEERGIEGMG